MEMNQMVIGGDTTRSAFEGQIIPHFDCLNIRVRLCVCAWNRWFFLFWCGKSEVEYKQYLELKKRVEMRMFWPGGALKSYSREECHQALD